MNHNKRILFILLSIVLFTAQSRSEPVVKAPDSTQVATPGMAEKPIPHPADVIASPSPAKKLEDMKVETPRLEDTRYGKLNRPLGDFLVGPYATAVALPRPISFGVEAKWKDLIGFSGGYGFFPELTISDVKLKITGSDFRLKVYPFQGSFYIGLGYGTQTFTGSQSQTVSGVPVTVTVSQDNQFIAPHVGWNWVWESGFFMGMDLGVQLSMKRDLTVTGNVPTNTPGYADVEKDVKDKAELVGKTPLPLLTLIKVGYFF